MELIGMGRPPHLPTPSERRQVESMAGYGIPEADIARVLDIDAKTLRNHYRDELDTGHVIANAKVSESLFRKAVGDHRQAVTAAIFWLKTRARWREATAQNSDGGPVQVRLEAMSDMEGARRIAFLQRKTGECDGQAGAGLLPSRERQNAPGQQEV